MSNYDFDSSEYIKDTQKAYKRLSDKFNVEVWAFLAESLDEWEDLVRADERRACAERITWCNEYDSGVPERPYIRLEDAIGVIERGFGG